MNCPPRHDALRRVTSTPLLANSFDASAMLTVNITGCATGTALINSTSTSAIGSRSDRREPRTTVTNAASKVPTMMNSQRSVAAELHGAFTERE
jgi:hypothetical protein